jgi:hypothetical protein
LKSVTWKLFIASLPSKGPVLGGTLPRIPTQLLDV